MVKQKGEPSNFHEQDRADERGLVLFNDEVNSFEFVISSLVEVCKHEFIQAEQCAMIAHLKGKCFIKNGTYPEIKPMYDELTLRGLTVSIE